MLRSPQYHSLYPARLLIVFLINSLYLPFTVASRGCSRSVQFAGMYTDNESFMQFTPSTTTLTYVGLNQSFAVHTDMYDFDLDV